MSIITIGIDLAKNVFAVHGVDANGKAVLVNPRGSREQLLPLIAQLPPCRVGMEACSVRTYPQVEVRLQLSVNPPALTEDAFDVCIRFGAPPDARVIARHIVPNRRLLCA